MRTLLTGQGHRAMAQYSSRTSTEVWYSEPLPKHSTRQLIMCPISAAENNQWFILHHPSHHADFSDFSSCFAPDSMPIPMTSFPVSVLTLCQHCCPSDSCATVISDSKGRAQIKMSAVHLYSKPYGHYYHGCCVCVWACNRERKLSKVEVSGMQWKLENDLSGGDESLGSRLAGYIKMELNL